MTFAKIESGVVVNVQELSSEDAQDPAFVWVEITSLTPKPGVGWTYSGSVFSAPPVPPLSLEEAIAAKVERALNEVNDYLTSHYDRTLRRDFTDVLLVAHVTENAAAQAYALSLFTWVRSVMVLYYARVVAIYGAASVEAVDAISLDFSEFDETDPNVALSAASALLA